MTPLARLHEMAERAAAGKPEMIRAAVKRLERANVEGDEREGHRWFNHLQALNRAWGMG